MEKANISSVLLKNLAVPSIALRAPACDTVPAVECNSDPLIQPVTSSMMECDTIPAIEYTAASTSTVKNMSSIVWRSILKEKIENATVLASIPSPKTQPANVTGGIAKLPKQKSIKIMSNSLILIKKKQEMSPRKKHMLRIIKTMKQKLKRKENKINSLENLLQTLRYN
ncbi:hypothetical protein EAI_06478 [Harpegnathos saltator]|uniref:Uncharacterized protein n=1 Tax=Harpegnathos saltator TaxID=610380 RepID=E2BW27_HARSA|nr:hypothetical protein EAI_06478 [Harpegnathos saltator]